MPLRAAAMLALTVGAWCATAGPLTELKSAIATRLLLMDDVARYKWNHELPIVDHEREAALLERATADAVAVGLPEAYARRVVGAQIEASRALQLELVAAWQRDQHPPFTDVPDLTAVQRPVIDAATRKLLEHLHESLCALVADDARLDMEAAPASLAHHRSAWSIATAALWSVPDDACPHPALSQPSAVFRPE